MTIADKLNYLNDTKQAIKQAITDKGVDVLETDTFRSYADKIASIEAGGGTGAEYKSSLMATTTQSAYSPSIVSLSDYVLPDYTIEKGQTGLLYPKRTTNEYSLNVPDLSHGFKYSSLALEGLTYTNHILKNTTYLSAGRIVTGVKLEVSANDSWEWCIRFKQTEKGGAQYIMNHDYYKTGPYLALDSTNALLFTVWDGSSYIASGTMTEPLELNNWYTVRVGSTGNSYFMQYKKDGEEWSEVSCHNATNLVALSPTTEIRIGKPSHDGLLVGEWDFSQSYIKINGEMLWPNDEQKYKGICTKDFMPQAGTNTLNAYHIEYTDGTSECLLGQTEPTGEDIKSVQLLESGLTFEENKAWTYNEDSEQFE